MRSSRDSSGPVSSGWTFLSMAVLRSGWGRESAGGIAHVVRIGAGGPAAGALGDHERLHATGAPYQLVVLTGVGSVAEHRHERLVADVDAAVHPVAGHVHRLTCA